MGELSESRSLSEERLDGECERVDAVIGEAALFDILLSTEKERAQPTRLIALSSSLPKSRNVFLTRR